MNTRLLARWDEDEKRYVLDPPYALVDKIMLYAADELEVVQLGYEVEGTEWSVAAAARKSAEVLKQYPAWCHPPVPSHQTRAAWQAQPARVHAAVGAWKSTAYGSDEEHAAAHVLASEFIRWADELDAESA